MCKQTAMHTPTCALAAILAILAGVLSSRVAVARMTSRPSALREPAGTVLPGSRGTCCDSPEMCCMETLAVPHATTPSRGTCIHGHGRRGCMIRHGRRRGTSQNGGRDSNQSRQEASELSQLWAAGCHAMMPSRRTCMGRPPNVIE
jgi:hypothetical protein